MNKPYCNAVGRVWKEAKIVVGDGKKAPYLQFILEITPRHFNGINFAHRIEVRTFNAVQQLAQVLKPGTVVSVNGEATPYLMEQDGKPYANIRIVGCVSIVEDWSRN